ncbi:MAG: hypothetical protein K0Q77_465 [Anaerosporomusa subterranea]|jgi:hypothetical protein|nr:hypothetical protein [Anaerosporomusa subterranea]MDF2499751.1 hypothetical protein [Anaerosporomusa subterranea]
MITANLTAIMEAACAADVSRDITIILAYAVSNEVSMQMYAP